MRNKVNNSRLEEEVARLRAENIVLRRGHISVAIASSFNTLVRWGGTVGIVYWIYRSIAVLAGHQTMADIGIKFLANVSVSQALAVLLGSGGILYGVAERGQKKKTTRHLTERIHQLEKQVDPNRTTSGLLPTGETRPEDFL